jgi:hypothetical protein
MALALACSGHLGHGQDQQTHTIKSCPLFMDGVLEQMQTNCWIAVPMLYSTAWIYNQINTTWVCVDDPGLALACSLTSGTKYIYNRIQSPRLQHHAANCLGQLVQQQGHTIKSRRPESNTMQHILSDRWSNVLEE